MNNVFLVIAHYGYEGIAVESVWSDKEKARIESNRLNLERGDDHEAECGPDPSDCLCRYRVRTELLR